MLHLSGYEPIVLNVGFPWADDSLLRILPLETKQPRFLTSSLSRRLILSLAHPQKDEKETQIECLEWDGVSENARMFSFRSSCLMRKGEKSEDRQFFRPCDFLWSFLVEKGIKSSETLVFVGNKYVCFVSFGKEFWQHKKTVSRKGDVVLHRSVESIETINTASDPEDKGENVVHHAQSTPLSMSRIKTSAIFGEEPGERPILFSIDSPVHGPVIWGVHPATWKVVCFQISSKQLTILRTFSIQSRLNLRELHGTGNDEEKDEDTHTSIRIAPGDVMFVASSKCIYRIDLAQDDSYRDFTWKNMSLWIPDSLSRDRTDGMEKWMNNSIGISHDGHFVFLKDFTTSSIICWNNESIGSSFASSSLSSVPGRGISGNSGPLGREKSKQSLLKSGSVSKMSSSKKMVPSASLFISACTNSTKRFSSVFSKERIRVSGQKRMERVEHEMLEMSKRMKWKDVSSSFSSLSLSDDYESLFESCAMQHTDEEMSIIAVRAKHSDKWKLRNEELMSSSHGFIYICDFESTLQNPDEEKEETRPQIIRRTCNVDLLLMRAEEVEINPNSFIIGGSSDPFQTDQILLESLDSRGKSLILRKQSVNDWMMMVLDQKNGMKQLRKIVELNPALGINAFSFATTVALENRDIALLEEMWKQCSNLEEKKRFVLLMQDHIHVLTLKSYDPRYFVLVCRLASMGAQSVIDDVVSSTKDVHDYESVREMASFIVHLRSLENEEIHNGQVDEDHDITSRKSSLMFGIEQYEEFRSLTREVVSWSGSRASTLSYAIHTRMLQKTDSAMLISSYVDNYLVGLFFKFIENHQFEKASAVSRLMNQTKAKTFLTALYRTLEPEVRRELFLYLLEDEIVSNESETEEEIRFVEELESLSDGNYAAFENLLHKTTMKLSPFMVDSKSLTRAWSPSSSPQPFPTMSPIQTGQGVRTYGSFCMDWFRNTPCSIKNRMKIERQLSCLGVKEVVSLWQSREQSMELFKFFLDHMNFEGIVEWCQTVSLFPRVSLMVVQIDTDTDTDADADADDVDESTHVLGVKHDERDESHEMSHVQRHFGWDYEELTEFIANCLESEEQFVVELVRENLGMFGIILPDERNDFRTALRRLILSTSFFCDNASMPSSELILGDVSLADVFPKGCLSVAHKLCVGAFVHERDHEGAIRYLKQFSLIDDVDFSGMFSGEAEDWIKFVQRMSSSDSPLASEVSRLNLSQMQVAESDSLAVVSTLLLNHSSNKGEGQNGEGAWKNVLEGAFARCHPIVSDLLSRFSDSKTNPLSDVEREIDERLSFKNRVELIGKLFSSERAESWTRSVRLLEFVDQGNSCSPHVEMPSESSRTFETGKSAPICTQFFVEKKRPFEGARWIRQMSTLEAEKQKVELERYCMLQCQSDDVFFSSLVLFLLMDWDVRRLVILTQSLRYVMKYHPSFCFKTVPETTFHEIVDQFMNISSSVDDPTWNLLLESAIACERVGYDEYLWDVVDGFSKLRGRESYVDDLKRMSKEKRWMEFLWKCSERSVSPKHVYSMVKEKFEPGDAEAETILFALQSQYKNLMVGSEVINQSALHRGSDISFRTQAGHGSALLVDLLSSKDTSIEEKSETILGFAIKQCSPLFVLVASSLIPREQEDQIRLLSAWFLSSPSWLAGMDRDAELSRWETAADLESKKDVLFELITMFITQRKLDFAARGIRLLLPSHTAMLDWLEFVDFASRGKTEDALSHLDAYWACIQSDGSETDEKCEPLGNHFVIRMAEETLSLVVELAQIESSAWTTLAAFRILSAVQTKDLLPKPLFQIYNAMHTLWSCSVGLQHSFVDPDALIQLLIDEKKFDAARKLSDSCDLDPHMVDIYEAHSTVQKRSKEMRTIGMSFGSEDVWNHCYRIFKQNECPPMLRVLFYLKQMHDLKDVLTLRDVSVIVNIICRCIETASKFPALSSASASVGGDVSGCASNDEWMKLIPGAHTLLCALGAILGVISGDDESQSSFQHSFLLCCRKKSFFELLFVPTKEFEHSIPLYFRHSRLVFVDGDDRTFVVQEAQRTIRSEYGMLATHAMDELMMGGNMLEALKISNVFQMQRIEINMASYAKDLAEKRLLPEEIPHEILNSMRETVNERMDVETKNRFRSREIVGFSVDELLEFLSLALENRTGRSSGCSVLVRRIITQVAVARLLSISYASIQPATHGDVLRRLLLRGREHFHLARNFVQEANVSLDVVTQSLSSVLVDDLMQSEEKRHAETMSRIGTRVAPASVGREITSKPMFSRPGKQQLLPEVPLSSSYHSPPESGRFFPHSLSVTSPAFQKDRRGGGHASSFTSSSSVQNPSYVPLRAEQWTLDVFREFVSVSKEPTLLGESLLKAATTDTTSRALAVECFIFALWSFETRSCVEGAERVMISARMFAKRLREDSEYILMVKLLTGIGKFSWLSFVVDALIEDGQFEVLLGKAYDTHGEPPFAGELAMYLQERYPRDRNKLVLVFERCGMYRQLGQELEREGRRLLSSDEFHSLIKLCTGDGMETISKKSGKHQAGSSSSSMLATQSDFHSLLLRIQDTFVGAAQGYAAAESFSSADRCWNLASLMQVQSRTKIRVVNIAPDEVRVFLATCKIFEDAMVVAEAYEMADLSTWINPLYHRVIRAGEMMYLDSFLEIVPVPASLFTEVVAYAEKKESVDGVLPSHVSTNMKSFALQCDDLETQYQIANRMKWEDVKKTVQQQFEDIDMFLS